MPVFEHITYIKAPIDVCFDLARNVEVHMQSTSQTKEVAVDGVMSGLLEKGDCVTWEATHFGVRQRLTAKVTEMVRPDFFIDVQVNGAFQSFTHTHEFTEIHYGTMMKDTFAYEAPLGIIGRIADKLFLENYMKKFIVSRSNELKILAEIQMRETV
ncbi:SRPBCC family protein [Paenisporosarcina sp. NPDC076898]|uniref:SRPBCC family protein n=1 Tax=unclassified Paenisporosarcina TaxID=2642018 RepID=UPI003CFFEEA5